MQLTTKGRAAIINNFFTISDFPPLSSCLLFNVIYKKDVKLQEFVVQMPETNEASASKNLQDYFDRNSLLAKIITKIEVATPSISPPLLQNSFYYRN